MPFTKSPDFDYDIEHSIYALDLVTFILEDYEFDPRTPHEHDWSAGAGLLLYVDLEMDVFEPMPVNRIDGLVTIMAALTKKHAESVEDRVKFVRWTTDAFHNLFADHVNPTGKVYAEVDKIPRIVVVDGVTYNRAPIAA